MENGSVEQWSSEVYNTFIARGAVSSVNISDRVRKRIHDLYKADLDPESRMFMFREARKAVLKDLRNNLILQGYI